MTRLQGDNSNRTFLVIGTVIAAALIALALFSVNGKPKTSNAIFNFDLSGQPIIGKANAPVAMVVFADYKCPNCKNFEDNMLPELRSKYLDTGKVKLVPMNFPFLAENAQLPVDDSKLAAEAVECAFKVKDSAAYDTLSTYLFRQQGSESEVWATKTKLKSIASNVEGLDQTAFGTCLETDATAKAVESDKSVAISAGVNGTPTIFINGKKLDSYALADVSTAIDAALKK